MCLLYIWNPLLHSSILKVFVSFLLCSHIGILLSVKNRAHHKVQKLKEINGNLVHQVNELQERNTKMVSSSSLTLVIMNCINY